MTDEEVASLIRGGESLTVEFKSDRKKLELREVYEACVCLANTDGGVLLIGVENNRVITGIHPTREVQPHALQAAIFNNTIPAIGTKVRFAPLEGHVVAVVEVPRGQAICATKAGACFRRVLKDHGPECIPFYPFEHTSRLGTLGMEDLTRHPVPAGRWSDLDPAEFERLRRLIRRSPGDRRLLEHSDAELAKALKLVESDEHGELVPTVAGLLVLGREEAIERSLPTHDTRFQVMNADRSLPVNEPLPRPLLKQFEELESRLKLRNEDREVMIDFQRVPVPAYDPEGLREAVLNALVHRDFARLGTTYVQWHADHLLIASPGGFPVGITQDNILVHEPVPRNPRLAEVFNRIGLVEQSARGVDRIYEGQARLGHALPDYTMSDAQAVRLRLSGGGANLPFVRLLALLERRLDRRMTLEEVLPLHLAYTMRRVTAEDVQRTLQRPIAYSRSLLEKMVEMGVLERQGRRTHTYLLAAAQYRILGQSVEYVRARGLDDIQQENMIRQFVEAHGSITRKQAASLCMAEDLEAKAILKRLANAGALALVGERRNARYIMADHVTSARPRLAPIAGEHLVEAIKALLKDRGELSLQEIEDGLAKEGFEVAGNNKRNYLTGILSRRKATFTGLGRGRYKLAHEEPS